MITLNKRETAKLVKQYENGATLRELSQTWSRSLPVIRRLLIEGGATIRPRGPQTKNF